MRSGTGTDTASAIWLELANSLRAFIRKRLPAGLDPEDVLQDVFLRIHQNLPSLRETTRLNAWVFQTTRNAITDALRSRARRARLNPEDASSAEGAPAEKADASSEKELSRCIAPLVARLPAHYRQAVELIEFEGFDLAGAAAAAKISVSGMKSRVQRGRTRLKALLLSCCEVELDQRGGVVDYARRRGPCVGCGGDPIEAKPNSPSDRISAP